MTTRRIFVLVVLFSAALSTDILWISWSPSLRNVLNVSLLAVIALTIGERLRIGMVAAVGTGVVWTQFSALTGPLYLVAFPVAVGASWIFSRKIVTTRSGISFISTIMVGTAAYAIALIAVDLVWSAIDRQRLHLDLLTTCIAGGIQIIVHPLILSVLWRLFGRNQYHRLSSSPTQSF